ncbi:MAG: hypothetical protein ACI9CB_000774 [Rhodothermales bacterium]|jgi:hypothetical protein
MALAFRKRTIAPTLCYKPMLAETTFAMALAFRKRTIAPTLINKLVLTEAIRLVVQAPTLRFTFVPPYHHQNAV